MQHSTAQSVLQGVWLTPFPWVSCGCWSLVVTGHLGSQGLHAPAAEVEAVVGRAGDDDEGAVFFRHERDVGTFEATEVFI